MLRLRLAAASSLVLFLGASWLMGQDNKSAPDKEPPTPTKSKARLPQYFTKLGLTDDQIQKVSKIHTSFKSKIDGLTEQIDELKNQERLELSKVLDERQRTRLRELRAKEPREPAKDAPAKDSEGEKKTEKTETKTKTDK
jgi:TolA-binding protein